MAVGPVGQFRAGKNSRISGNGTILNQASWESEWANEKIDTTCFESEGNTQGMTAPNNARWNFKGLFDAGENPYDDPPGIFPQDEYPNLLLYTNTVDNVFWDFPVALILSAQNGSEVRQGVTFGASGENNGEFTPPVGSAA